MKSFIGYVLCSIVVVYGLQVTELRAEVPLNGLTPDEKLTGLCCLMENQQQDGATLKRLALEMDGKCKMAL
jgi:hypothetical protein